MANTTAESLSSPPHTIDSENCLNSTDELQQMIDDEMENIDSGVYGCYTNVRCCCNNLPSNSLITSTTTTVPTTPTATPKPFEFDEDALDNL
ncbi:hypothetical protein DOY81_012558 [Sarcophaga bullata]|nr:hypothetical protein DOY81_012558 [Sarcophaga bullata]